MYKDIIYKPSTVDELINSQLIAFKNGWNEQPLPIFKSNITEYIIFSIERDNNDRKLIFSLSRDSFSPEECLKHCLKFNGGDYVYFDNFIEFSKYMTNNKRQINYNEPKKLVYESIDNKEDIIILPINNEYDFLNIKNMILKSGYVFEYPDYNEHDCKYTAFTFRPKKKIFYMCTSVFSRIYKWYQSSNDHNIIEIDSPNKLFFYLNSSKVINYNEPRKLVYENIDNDNKTTILYQPKSDIDLIECQDFLYKNNYVCDDPWNEIGGEDQEIMYNNITSDIYLLFIDKESQIFCNIEDDQFDTVDELLDMAGVDKDSFCLITDNLSLLKRNILGKISINYNEPRKLVYENKLLKFNNFKI